MQKFKPITLFFILILLYGCSEATKPSKEIKAIQTTGPVTENNSVYSGGLECLGKLITESEQGFNNNKIKAAVGNIQDKTGKKEGMGQPLSQAASDMALTALSRVNAIHLIAMMDIKDMTHVPLTKYDPNQINTLVAANNIGSIFPSHFFLSGSISEYNEDIRVRNWGLSFFRKLLDIDFSGGDKVFSIAMDLKLVSSPTGRILRLFDNKKLPIILT